MASRFGLSVEGNWMTPIVSESRAAAAEGDNGSRTAVRATSNPPPQPGVIRLGSRKTFVRCIGKRLKRLKADAPGHIIRRQRGRIRDTQSCVFQGTKQRIACFRPEVRKGHPRVVRALQRNLQSGTATEDR